MAGRRPKPTAVKALTGNPGKRPLNTKEPKPRGVAKCPDELSPEAKKEWKRQAPGLIALGLLTDNDMAGFAAYCTSYATFLEADQHVQKTGLVIRTPKGYPIQNPFIGIRNTALDIMRKFQVEFGMTPSSRSRLQVEAGARPDDSLDAFLSEIPEYDDASDPLLN